MHCNIARQWTPIGLLEMYYSKVKEQQKITLNWKTL